MSDENEPTLQPDLDGELYEITGAAIVTLFKRSAALAEGNFRYALEIAQKLSLRLVASENRVAEFEARLTERALKPIGIDRNKPRGGFRRSLLQQRVAGKPH